MYARSEQHDARVTRASGFTRPSRWAGRALFCALIAFIAALVPVGFGYHYTSVISPCHTIERDVIVGFSTSTAYAESGEVANAEGFLQWMANTAGVSANNFVVAVTGLCGVGSGYIIAGDDAINYENTLDENLSYLADAADYPAWTSLSAAEQSRWGTESRYDTAKFNALCDAFGIGDLRQQYYASGGGDFDNVDENQIAILKHIGGIGQRWSDNMSASFASMKSLFPDGFAANVGDFLAVEGDVFNGSGKEGWDGPSTTVYVSYGNTLRASGGSGSSTLYFMGRPNVYWILARSGATCYYAAFSLDNFADTWNSTTRAVINGTTFYYRRDSIRNNPLNSVQIDGVEVATNGVEWNVSAPYVYYWILTNGMGSAPATMPGYPEGGADTINDYTYYVYPEEGVKQGDTYQNFITENPTRPENPYNPNNQTSTPEWKDDTAANVIPLTGIKFDKLFPFCLSYDVKNLFTKVQEVTLPETQTGVYNVVSVPFVTEVFGPDSVFELDLTWVHDLLIMVRPFIQILIAAGLIFSLVWFWRGILTG